MAIRFNALGDYLKRTSGLTNFNSAYTVFFRVYIASDLNTYSAFWGASTATSEGSTVYQNSDIVQTGTDGLTTAPWAFVSDSGEEGSGSALSTATWYSFAIVRTNASTLTLYVDGSSFGTCTKDITGRGSVGMQLLGQFSEAYADCRIEGFKEWSVALNSTEISEEHSYLDAKKRTDLVTETMMTAATVNDAIVSSVGTNWTANGTLAVETGSGATVGGFGGGTSITAGAGSLTAAGQAPSLGLGITPGAGTITVTGFATTDLERGLRYSYPTADTSVGPWAASTGTDLYAMIDEESASDTDYIYADALGTGKFKILPVTDPAASTGHVVNYRIWSPVSGNAKVRLVQGTTTIAEWTHTTLPSTATSYSQQLTGLQADAITDYDDLYLEFEAT